MQTAIIDLSLPGVTPVLHAMQGDSMSRFFSVTVTDSGVPWDAPSGAAWTVRFGAPGMPAGWYDTITEPDGGSHPAISVDGNTITVELAEQAVSVPGKNRVWILLNAPDGYQLASWGFDLVVEAVHGLDAPEATVYYNALAEQVAKTLANAQAATASAAQAQQYAESINPVQFATATQGAKADTAVQSVNGQRGTAVTLTPAIIGAADAAVVGGRLSALSEDIATERARIDAIASLAEGSTTGDAELIDIRVGVGGTNYNSAGAAVRGQIGELKDDLNYINDIIGVVQYVNPKTMTENTYWISAGTIAASSAWQSFGVIRGLKAGTYYFCGVNPTYSWVVNKTNNSSVTLGSLYSWTDTDYYKKHSTTINYDFDLYLSRQSNYSEVTKFSLVDFENTFSYDPLLSEIVYELQKEQEKDTRTILYVGANETYKNINSALNAITDNSEDKKYKIIVKSGTYDVPSNEPYFGIKNFVDIQGEDKSTVIVRNIYSTNSYDVSRATFDPQRYGESIMSANLSNMTIISQGCKCPIHIDGNNIANGGNITIDNCILMDLNTPNNYYTTNRLTRIGGVNCGLGNGQSVTVKNTISNGTLYAHNHSTTTTPSTFTIDNCTCRGTLIGCAYETDVKDNYIITNSTLDYVAIQTLYATSNKYNVVMSNNNINYIFAPNDDNITNPYGTFDTFFNGKCGIPDTSCMQLMFNCSDNTISRGDIVYSKSDGNNRGWLSGEYIRGTGTNFAGVAMEDIPAWSVGWVQNKGKISIPKIDNANYGDLIDFVNGEFIAHQSGDTPIGKYAEISPLYDNQYMIQLLN